MGRHRRIQQQLQQQFQQGYHQALQSIPKSDPNVATIIRGMDGKPGEMGPKGDTGKDGKDGRDGVDGKDGSIPDIGIKVTTDTLKIEDSISTLISWTEIKYNTGIEFVTDDSTFTIVKPGKYDIGVSVNWEQHTAGTRILGAIKNIVDGGTILASTQNIGISDMYPQGMTLSLIDDLKIGDTLTFFVHQTSGDELKLGVSNFSTIIANNIVGTEMSAWIQYRSS